MSQRKYKLSDFHPYKISVRDICASSLPRMNRFHDFNWCEVYIRLIYGNKDCGKTSVKTVTRLQRKEAAWEETFNFDILSTKSYKELVLLVYDENTSRKDELIGQVRVRLTDANEVHYDEEILLDGSSEMRGRLKCTISVEKEVLPLLNIYEANHFPPMITTDPDSYTESDYVGQQLSTFPFRISLPEYITKQLSKDISKDIRNILNNDLEANCIDENLVIRRECGFAYSTCIPCSTEVQLPSYPTLPIFEKKKYLIQIQTTNGSCVLKTDYMCSMWAWLRALKLAYDTENETEFRFQAPLELYIENDDGSCLGADWRGELTKCPLQIVMKKDGKLNKVFSLESSLALIVSSDYSVPSNYHLSVHVLSTNDVIGQASRDSISEISTDAEYSVTDSAETEIDSNDNVSAEEVLETCNQEDLTYLSSSLEEAGRVPTSRFGLVFDAVSGGVKSSAKAMGEFVNKAKEVGVGVVSSAKKASGGVINSAKTVKDGIVKKAIEVRGKLRRSSISNVSLRKLYMNSPCNPPRESYWLMDETKTDSNSNFSFSFTDDDINCVDISQSRTDHGCYVVLKDCDNRMLGSQRISFKDFLLGQDLPVSTTTETCSADANMTLNGVLDREFDSSIPLDVSVFLNITLLNCSNLPETLPTAANAVYRVKCKLLNWNGDIKKESVALTSRDSVGSLEWNPPHEFKIVAENGLGWAEYINLDIFNGHKVIGSAVIPIGDFSTTDTEKDYSLNRSRLEGIGRVVNDAEPKVKVRMQIKEEKIVRDEVPIIKTRSIIRSSTIYNTMWHCTVIPRQFVSAPMDTAQSHSGKFVVFPSFHGLLLVDPVKYNEGSNLLKLTHFRQRKTDEGGRTVTSVAVYENEMVESKFNVLSKVSWSPCKQRHYTDESGRHPFPYEDICDPDIAPPHGYIWDGNWKLARKNADDEGWTYAKSFESLHSDETSSKSDGNSFRRKGWIRVITEEEGSVPDRIKSPRSKPLPSPSHSLDTATANKPWINCREMKDPELSTMVIPWDQVQANDVLSLTPSVACLAVRIHTQRASSTIDDVPIDIDIFVHCPAERFSSLCRERISLYQHRQSISKVLAEVGETANEFNRINLSQSDEAAEDEKLGTISSSEGLQVDTVQLTPAAETFQALSREVYDLIKSIEVYQESHAHVPDDVIYGILRRRRYCQTLLEIGRNRNDFDHDGIQENMDADFQKFDSFQSSMSPIDAALSQILYLIDSAETKISEVLVREWINNKDGMISTLHSLMNGYYIEIVSLLSEFFDYSGFELLRGMDEKTKLIKFFVENDDRFSNSLTSYFQLFGLSINFAPKLSELLDIDVFLCTFNASLSADLMSTVDKVVHHHMTYSKDEQEKGDGCIDSPLPWYPLYQSRPIVSNIYKDLKEALDGYLEVVTGLLRSSTQRSDLVERLKANVSIYCNHGYHYFGRCCLDVLRENDWTSARDPESDQLDGNITFLCSIANDAHRFNMDADNSAERSDLQQSLFHTFDLTRDRALELLSCVIMKFYEKDVTDFNSLPTRTLEASLPIVRGVCGSVSSLISTGESSSCLYPECIPILLGHITAKIVLLFRVAIDEVDLTAARVAYFQSLRDEGIEFDEDLLVEKFSSSFSEHLDNFVPTPGFLSMAYDFKVDEELPYELCIESIQGLNLLDVVADGTSLEISVSNSGKHKKSEVKEGHHPIWLDASGPFFSEMNSSSILHISVLHREGKLGEIAIPLCFLNLDKPVISLVKDVNLTTADAQINSTIGQLKERNLPLPQIKVSLQMRSVICIDRVRSIKITRIECRDLKKVDMTGNDPFVKLSMREWSFRTKEISNAGSCAAWSLNETLPPEICQALIKSDRMCVQVFDKNWMKNDKLIGSGSFVLSLSESAQTISLFDERMVSAGSVTIIYEIFD